MTNIINHPVLLDIHPTSIPLYPHTARPYVYTVIYAVCSKLLIFRFPLKGGRGGEME